VAQDQEGQDVRERRNRARSINLARGLLRLRFARALTLRQSSRAQRVGERERMYYAAARVRFSALLAAIQASARADTFATFNKSSWLKLLVFFVSSPSLPLEAS